MSQPYDHAPADDGGPVGPDDDRRYASPSGGEPVSEPHAGADGPYAPPYGSAPAYGDPAYGASYDGPQPVAPVDRPDAGDQAPPSTPPPTAARPRRRRGGAIALLVAACLASGAIGGVVVNAFDSGGNSTTTPVAAPSTITRGSSAPVPAQSGTPAAAAASIAPSVVTIAVTGTQTVTGGFGQTQTQRVGDTGSGIVLRTDGYIVTNNHVVAAAANGGTVSVTFADGTTVPARIVGTDPTSDLAVIKVDGQQELKAAVFADSDKIVVGQTVLAVGAPLGLSNTVTEGIVSTLHRPVRTGEPGASEQSVIDAVQTDAAINPGNSGGALVDLSGQVVGVNSAIASTGGGSSGGQAGNIGVGFAIPSNDVAKVAKELIDTGQAAHPQIGISVADAPSAVNGTPGRGALVRAVQAGGPAAAAGLQQGDVLTKVDDREVTDADSLIVAVRSHNPGDVVTLTYLRAGQTATTKVTLEKAPTS